MVLLTGGGGVGTCRRWPQVPQFSLTPAADSGAWSCEQQRGGRRSRSSPRRRPPVGLPAPLPQPDPLRDRRLAGVVLEPPPHHVFVAAGVEQQGTGPNLPAACTRRKGPVQLGIASTQHEVPGPPGSPQPPTPLTTGGLPRAGLGRGGRRTRQELPPRQRSALPRGGCEGRSCCSAYPVWVPTVPGQARRPETDRGPLLTASGVREPGPGLLPLAQVPDVRGPPRRLAPRRHAVGRTPRRRLSSW
jgi:hypothetical protein